jgi:glutathione S-transferase
MPYDIKLYKRTEERLAPAELKAISPLGTSPCITDVNPATGQNVVLSETNAIIDYILDKQQQKEGNDDGIKSSMMSLRPGPMTKDRADYLFLYHGAQGSLGPTVTQDFVWKLVVSKVPCPLSYIFKMVYNQLNDTLFDPRINKFMTLVEEKLDGRDYVASADNITAADITLIFPMEEVLKDSDMMKEKYPRCEAWRQRMYQRDAHKRAVSKVGETSGQGGRKI